MDEEYYLQIDSHMRFAEGWDSEIISQLKACPANWPVLSTYPPGYERGQSASSMQAPPTVLCASDFGHEGMLRIKGKIMLRSPDAPVPSSLSFITLKPRVE